MAEFIEDETKRMIDMNQSEYNLSAIVKRNLADDVFLPEGSRRDIGSMVWIFRVSDIDLVKETFFVTFGVEFEWQCTKTEYERYKADPQNYVPDYCPDFIFLNGQCDKELQITNENQGYKICTTGDTGTFGETFGSELRYLSLYCTDE